jgi:hypothetical protein
MAHRHESKLLKAYANNIFQEHQSKLPYYTTALAFYKLENLFREEILPKEELYSFKAHLLMIFRELISGQCPSINTEKAIDDHCKPNDKTEDTFRKAIDIFLKCKQAWTTEMNKSSFGMKDILEFTKLLLSNIESKPIMHIQKAPEPEICTYKGLVIKIINDRYGMYCGFIKRVPEDIFFHSNNNKDLDFESLEGKLVCYNTQINPRNNKLMAIDVKTA